MGNEVYRYDPNGMKTWASKVARYMDEEIRECSEKFKAQSDILCQPGVWTGSAAVKNYTDFCNMHKSLINFVNAFGEAFKATMDTANERANQLDTDNLGKGIENLGLTFSSMNVEDAATIRSDVDIYDYGKIMEVGESLKGINTDLTATFDKITKALQEIANGEGLWDGRVASAQRAELENVLNATTPKVLENLQICIDNIANAGANAEAADRAA